MEVFKIQYTTEDGVSFSKMPFEANSLDEAREIGKLFSLECCCMDVLPADPDDIRFFQKMRMPLWNYPMLFGELAGLCGRKLLLTLVKTDSGFCIGTIDADGNPCTRESVEYWPSWHKAQDAFLARKWTQRRLI